jgi:hypothetical protein
MAETFPMIPGRSAVVFSDVQDEDRIVRLGSKCGSIASARELRSLGVPPSANRQRGRKQWQYVPR